MSLQAEYKNAAIEFAACAALDEKNKKKRADKLTPLAKDFVSAAEYVAEHWDTYKAGFDAKSGMKAIDARRKWLCEALGIDAEPCKDWFSRVKTVGENAERAREVLANGARIHSAEYFAQQCRKKSGASHATDRAESSDDDAETEVAPTQIDPAARLAKMAADFFDYGAKHGFDEATLFTMLESAAPSAVFATQEDLDIAV